MTVTHQSGRLQTGESFSPFRPGNPRLRQAGVLIVVLVVHATYSRPSSAVAVMSATEPRLSSAAASIHIRDPSMPGSDYRQRGDLHLQGTKISSCHPTLHRESMFGMAVGDGQGRPQDREGVRDENAAFDPFDNRIGCSLIYEGNGGSQDASQGQIVLSHSNSPYDDLRPMNRVKFSPTLLDLRNANDERGNSGNAENARKYAQNKGVEGYRIFPSALPNSREPLPKGYGYFIVAGMLGGAVFGGLLLAGGCWIVGRWLK